MARIIDHPDSAAVDCGHKAQIQTNLYKNLLHVLNIHDIYVILNSTFNVNTHFDKYSLLI